MKDVCLVAEVDSEIGFGHLSEIRALARTLEAIGAAPEIIAIGPLPPDKRWHIGHWVEDMEAAALVLSSQAPGVSVWSMRRPLRRRAVKIFREIAGRKVWLSDQPQLHPAVDLLVSPTILQRRHSRSRSAARVLFGPAYFPLDPIYASPPPSLEGRPNDVLLTLGGADRTMATLSLLPAVAGQRSTVVIGPGFQHRDRVTEAADQLKIRYVEAPETLYSLLRSHRLVVSSGGNTLYEAAATGTPACVAWEDPHEEEQALAFAAAGAATVLGRGAAVSVGTVRDAILAVLGSPSGLYSMACRGRSLVDGQGARRLAEVILELESVDRSTPFAV